MGAAGEESRSPPEVSEHLQLVLRRFDTKDLQEVQEAKMLLTSWRPRRCIIKPHAEVGILFHHAAGMYP
jgi:hypothetical protein